MMVRRMMRRVKYEDDEEYRERQQSETQVGGRRLTSKTFSPCDVLVVMIPPMRENAVPKTLARIPEKYAHSHQSVVR